jgi:hypothetical protein
MICRNALALRRGYGQQGKRQQVYPVQTRSHYRNCPGGIWRPTLRVGGEVGRSLCSYVGRRFRLSLPWFEVEQSPRLDNLPI